MGHEELLRALGETMAKVVGVSYRQPTSVRVSAGDVAVEVHWPEVAERVEPVVPEQVSVPDGHQVLSEMVGVFYTAPEPGAAPFVAVGDVVSVGQQIGIIEAMKLMIPVKSDVDGRVVDVLAADATAVEYGQPLFAVGVSEV